MAANHYPASGAKVTVTPSGGVETEVYCESFDPKVYVTTDETTKIGASENHDAATTGWSLSMKLKLHRSQWNSATTIGLSHGSRTVVKFYPDRTDTSRYDSYPIIVDNVTRGVSNKGMVMVDVSCKARGDDGDVAVAVGP